MFHFIPPVLYPILLTVVCLIGCIATFMQAKEENTDGNNYFPEISDLGDSRVAPELFSLFFTLYTMIAYFVLTYRYEQVKSCYRFNDYKCLQVANVVSYGSGLMSCMGMWFLINFRQIKKEDKAIIVNVHLAGKWIAYSMGVIYVITQTAFSFFWKDLPQRSCYIIVIRAAHTLVHLGMLIAFIVLQERYMKNIFSTPYKKEVVIIEWIVIFMPSLFSLTFIPEFYKMTVKFNVERAYIYQPNGDIPIPDVHIYTDEDDGPTTSDNTEGRIEIMSGACAVNQTDSDCESFEGQVSDDIVLLETY